MREQFYSDLEKELENLKENGLFKEERIIASPQNSKIFLEGGAKVLNFCANNYLGLANNQELVHAGQKYLEEFGFGLSSVRFICGTQTIHRKLENKVSEFLGTEDTILYTSCFDANGGLFGTVLTAEDAIISDQLNHASIIDGVRLCKAKRFRYKNSDMSDLEAQLKAADEDGARYKMIATDGVFSMDGFIAKLPEICDLADKYDALVMVDDSHATGFVGGKGKGTPEYHGVMDKIDIITSTFGKALGGATGGFTSGRQPLVEMLRQRSRPYLFSNSLAPVVAATSLKALELIESSDDLRINLNNNSKLFRSQMTKLGFDLLPGDHPIIPVMLYDEVKAVEMADKLLEHGIYVIAFSYPVVPKGEARIRVQISAAHTTQQIEKAVEAFATVGRNMGVI